MIENLSKNQINVLRRLAGGEEIAAHLSSFRWPDGGRVHSQTIHVLNKLGLIEHDGQDYDETTRKGGWHEWTWVRISDAGREALPTPSKQP